MTKKDLINRFHTWQLGLGNTYSDIWKAYKNPSYNKVKAWRYWLEKMRKDYEAADFRILSKNSQAFTIGCIGWVNGLLTFIYITAYNCYYLPLEKIDEKTGEVINLNY